MTDSNDEKQKNYTVGYGRLPAASRFQPGRSGNPKGRRKRPDTIADQLHRALETRVPIVENGRRHTISAQEAIIRGLVNDAARRDPKAIRTLLALTDRYGKTDATTINPGDLAAEDQRILEQYATAFPAPPSSTEDNLSVETAEVGGQNSPTVDSGADEAVPPAKSQN
jgi:hypothetical protein